MRATTIRETPRGEYITLTATEAPKRSQVWIRGQHLGKGRYEIVRFNDINDSRTVRGEKQVFVDFIF